VESIPYQIKDVIEAMEDDSRAPLTELKIDGGITSNKFVVQFLADLLERKVTHMQIADVSALGAGYLAGLQAGVYNSINELKTLNQESTSTQSGNESEKVKKWYEGWKKMIKSR
jgi:glycerol kinase